MFKFTLLATSLILAAITQVHAEENTNVSDAREALSKKDTDADSEKALEEVFEAAEKNYSLLKQGGISLNYGFSYSYYADQRLDLVINPNLNSDGEQTGSSSIASADVNPSSTHTFTNSFTLDYGILDNLTVSSSVPLVAKFDTADELTNFSVGDISGTMRWQPFEYVPGKISQTYFVTVGLPTGDSPYKIDTDKNLSSGSGAYSISAGISASKVLDPVVLFGSASYRYGFGIYGLNQVRGQGILKSVLPGSDVSFSMGFAYSLSYDVSLSASFQGSFNTSTEFTTLDTITNKNRTSKTGSQMSGIMNFALGIRVSPKTIANVNVGYGLTELSPDIILGLSLPIDIEGLKKPVTK